MSVELAESEQYIYRLRDPRNLCIRYVGIAIDPNERMSRHLSCDGTNPEKDAWIKDLHMERLEPEMEIIEVVAGRVTGLEREKYWMEYYWDSGEPLTNIAYAPYQTIDALHRAIAQERIRRASQPITSKKYDRKNMADWEHQLLDLAPLAINTLLRCATTGTPSIVDKAVRVLTGNIEFVFPHLQEVG